MNKITILGMVQGIGFRPFVAALAESLGLSGNVRNSGGIVIIECNAETEVLGEFIRHLRFHSPRGASILDIQVEKVSDADDQKPLETGFQIITSDNDNEKRMPILPSDIAICPECRRELESSQDRRYRYPYISCTLCGPRYSILEKIPYDRENITMQKFAMCPACKAEYIEKKSRRRHAQTISCHTCGPQLILTDADQKETVGEDALGNSIRILNHGGILALKGVGGYLLCCSPFQKEAVTRLRELKQREKKPFAIMFENIRQAADYCCISIQEEELLSSPAAPIVLLRKKDHASQFAEEVCGESREIGAFLPYTGIHLLLLQACGPLVMTSCNISSEPIISNDDRMMEFYFSQKNAAYIDGIAWNKREIETFLDDSLCRIVEEHPFFIRRSRGYVPLPVILTGTGKTEQKILAYGGDLKAVFALLADQKVTLSQFFGDMEYYETEMAYEKQIKKMQELFQIEPDILVCDRHPGYFSSQLAVKHAMQQGKILLQVQHHHAHVASVMAEHHLTECIGAAMDGTGFGMDGAVWGSEFMICRGAEFIRRGHLSYTELLGGDAASSDAMMTALCQLLEIDQSEKDQSEEDRKMIDRKIKNLIQQDPEKRSVSPEMIRAALKHQINTAKSSSMGRLFDTVSSLLSIKQQNEYEGECAIALENLAAEALEHKMTGSVLHIPVHEGEDGCLIADRNGLLKQILRQTDDIDQGRIAIGFHNAVAEMICEMCDRIRSETGLRAVALSGGVFANMLLLKRTVSMLQDSGFEVYWNRQVPSNDGGISLGQAWIAQQLCRENKMDWSKLCV